MTTWMAGNSLALGPGLLLGLLLLAAIAGGHAARFCRIPRVVGYLAGGVTLRAILLALVESETDQNGWRSIEKAADSLSVVKDMALGLILFTIGGIFDRAKLKATVARTSRIGLCEASLSFLFVLVGGFLVFALTDADVGAGEAVVFCALLGVAAIATAPAATLLVLQEYDAKGPITDTILSLTGLNNIICIVAFYSLFFTLAGLGLIETSDEVSRHLLLSLAATTVGSVVVGIAVGSLLSISHVELPLSETLLIFFSTFILLGAGEKWLLNAYGVSYNFLLASLLCGAIFANTALDSQKLAQSLKTMGAPILAGFFVMTGFELHLAELSHMGTMGAAYVVFRIAGKVLGCRLGVKWATAPERAEGRLGSAMLCQAAVIIGIGAFVDRYWHSPLASRFVTIVLGSIVVFELIGPLLLKRTVVLGGEVKAITLLRGDRAERQGAGTLALTLQSLARLFGIKHSRSRLSVGEMRVEHIMRTNIQFIRAAHPFDEVLHFIERSTDSHFTVVSDEGLYVGVIHFSDVRDVIYDPAIRDLITAVDLADGKSPTVSKDVGFDGLLEMFHKHNLGVLPVVDGEGSRRVVGLVEQRDLLAALKQ